jgi:Ca-activated chloride channel family protein
MKTKRNQLFALALIASMGLIGCKSLFESGSEPQQQQQSPKASPDKTLNLVAGSENEDTRPILARFAQQNGVKINMTPMGSVDIMNEMQNPKTVFDAVWPANSIWIAMGDEGMNRVKNAESIYRSPVVFGIKLSIAKKLGWVDKKVTIQDILKASEDGKISVICTSATQSNSGASAYLASLYAFAKNPAMLTMENLRDENTRKDAKRFQRIFKRSAAGSGLLKQVFMDKYVQFDGMVNYESMVIEANRQLVAQGKEPLYVVYPINGLAVADAPLGYIEKGNSAKAEIFAKLKAYLLTPEVQNELMGQGKRTGIIGMSAEGASKEVFNPQWGIDLAKTLSPIRYPQADVLREALLLYQTAFRKPSFTIYILDYSGSMHGNGGERGVKESMRLLLDQNEAKKYMLQSTPGDITVAIPFNHGIIAEYTVKGNDPADLMRLYSKLDGLDADGGTDMYVAIQRAYEILNQNKASLGEYFPAIIVMTDGRSDDNRNNLGTLQAYVQSLRFNWDLPIFGITFGDADKRQLDALAAYSFGHVYDGKVDLVGTFKKAKGNN